MRRTLLLAAAVATVAAVPASADAPKPTCATATAYFATEPPRPSSCTSGDAPQVSGLVTFRQFHVHVATGEVHATLTCSNAWWSNTASATFTADLGAQTIEVVEDEGMRCVATLGTGTHGSSAAGYTSFTYRYPWGA